MKLLYANDKRGEHAQSWYHASCNIPQQPALDRAISADVCVIGAGITGLATALELAKRKISVVVLDAHRVGWGASGRNGGQLGSGFNLYQTELEESVGKEVAHALWQITQDAKSFVHELCAQHQLDIEFKPGIISAQHRARSVKASHEYCSFMNREYDYNELQPLSKADIRERVQSDDYHGGAIDHGGGHIHPLKWVAGLAGAAQAAGAKLFERSEVLRIDAINGSRGRRVITSMGSVRCETVVLAVNGYQDKLEPSSNSMVMPINNFIVVTESLGKQAEQLLPHDDAVADSRFVVNYFRRVDNNRLLFGGGENYSYRFPQNIEKTVRKAMRQVFPALAETGIDYAWGGTLAITRSRLPYLARLSQDIYTAGGYSGHGLALAATYGSAIAEHIDGQPDRFEQLLRLPTPAFPGGVLSRPALLALGMIGYSWLDKV